MRKLETDIVIISAGTAGLAAAVSAAEQGMKVVSVERNGAVGGNGNLGTGLFAVESRLQRLKEYTYTREQAYKNQMEFAHWDIDGRLVKQFIDRSADTLDWLEDMGIRFDGIASHGLGNYYTWHLIAADEDTPAGINTGVVAMKHLKERAEALGVRILLKTPAEKLITEEGRVVGVYCRDGEGELEIRSKAVISCAGGYGGYWRAPMGIPLYGDGLNMAREVGAEVSDGTMPIPQRPAAGTAVPAFKPPLMYRSIGGMGGMCQQPNMIVNLSGERFVDEGSVFADTHGYLAFQRQYKGVAYNIFTDDIVKEYMEHGFDIIGGNGIKRMGTPLEKPLDFYAEVELSRKNGDEVIFVANSAEELAGQCGLPVEAFCAAMEEYNQICDGGYDFAYGKRKKYLRPLRGERFYAVRSATVIGGGYPEGIAINYRFEVQTPEHKSIPGLYAAGVETGRSIWSDCYVNINCGQAYGWSINSGRIAAEYAAKYVKAL